MTNCENFSWIVTSLYSTLRFRSRSGIDLNCAEILPRVTTWTRGDLLPANRRIIGRGGCYENLCAPQNKRRGPGAAGAGGSNEPASKVD